LGILQAFMVLPLQAWAADELEVLRQQMRGLADKMGRLERARGTPPPCSPGWWRCGSSSSVTALSWASECSSGTTSASQTSASGSARVRQTLLSRFEGSAWLFSIRRALRSLTPALAAAETWLSRQRCSLYVCT
jgi:hypothetical protein